MDVRDLLMLTCIGTFIAITRRGVGSVGLRS
jgi:hypothetical protein